ncbi:uncharacterized protein MAM_08315 [Metarhizium album ARSEF 1941]|uniref:Uncharacterized protein n=1 Tax=Metarhizium album (strain ARSEF 1941) TaxID=1081103 RepID=A0A0B2WDC5_METAS|nr:uncharacterized protein MAM_08315 [Metarhizium album ARSEF 1941]KHN93836.1 hypothetical protein MAM_08315 [Metarhizium album ARSEF 1941]
MKYLGILLAAFACSVVAAKAAQESGLNQMTFGLDNFCDVQPDFEPTECKKLQRNNCTGPTPDGRGGMKRRTNEGIILCTILELESLDIRKSGMSSERASIHGRVTLAQGRLSGVTINPSTACMDLLSADGTVKQHKDVMRTLDSK